MSKKSRLALAFLFLSSVRALVLLFLSFYRAPWGYLLRLFKMQTLIHYQVAIHLDIRRTLQEPSQRMGSYWKGEV